jgi:hypothetical protein
MTQIGNSGRLAAKASILQDHIDGVANIHEASAIKLDPFIDINNTTTEEVRSAIQALADYIDEINVDATGVENGFITLTNDLGGTGSAPTVIQISGDGSNQLDITPRNLVFDNVGSTDIEIKYNTTSTSAKGIKIISQSSMTGGFSGGDITIQTGEKNPFSNGAKRGKIFLNLNTQNVLTAKHITNSSYIISLFGEATTTNIPGNANSTLFFFDASLDPASTPVGGSHLYSLSGKTRVFHTNGDNFNIGNTPATWVNHLESFGAINKITTVTTQGNSPETLFQYEHTSGNECTIMLETTIIGNLDPISNSKIYKYYASFYYDGIEFFQIGSTIEEYFEDGEPLNAATPPAINASGNFIGIDSGYNSDPIKWYANTKLHIIE